MTSCIEGRRLNKVTIC